MKNNNLKYRPSFLAIFAKRVLPFAKAILPAKIFAPLYDILYSSYKAMGRFQYKVKAIWIRIFGNDINKLKVNLCFRLLPHTMGGTKALENAFEVVSIVEAGGIKGSIIECGVAEGGTAAMLYMASEKLGTAKREFWFFDSFEGLPEPTNDDYIGEKTGEFIRPLPKGSCLGTIEQVQELMFDKLDFDKQRVNLIKGWFQDTVPAFKKKVKQPIAILRLDGDWYESTKIPLQNFYESISIGGVVIIDDYLTCFGSRKATDEFREELAIDSPLIPDGRGGVWFVKN